MGETTLFRVFLLILVAIDGFVADPIYSARLLHSFSDEVRGLLPPRGNGTASVSWPEGNTFRHMRMLLGSDLRRQKLLLAAQNQTLLASPGGQTFNYGNDLGWLHYAWIDIGTPHNSFLVGLDTGSDMFWVPCDCKMCAPLSISYYNMLDKELGEYSPSHSSSSKPVPCNHELCEMATKCHNPNGHCPYTINYFSEDTSSSGFLFEDLLHLASVGGNGQNSSVHAPVIMGCGSTQSGEYLSGIAPDGIMGLGPGDISVPSLLAKSGYAPHSFSFCYDKSYSGRLFFGDQGPTSQRSTSFLTVKPRAYIVEVEMYCVEGTCIKQTGHKAQVDTGSSFSYLPGDIYDQVLSEFNRKANATRVTIQGFHCYKASSLKGPNIPSIKLVFSVNQSFVVENPTFLVADDEGVAHRCLGIDQTAEQDIGLIGQNFMMGYRMVFDWEKSKLGWSASDCQGTGDGGKIHPIPPSNDNNVNDVSPNPLPTNQQQQNHNSHAVAPAVAGRAPPNRSAGSYLLVPYQNCIVTWLLLLFIAHITYI